MNVAGEKRYGSEGREGREGMRGDAVSFVSSKLWLSMFFMVRLINIRRRREGDVLGETKEVDRAFLNATCKEFFIHSSFIPRAFIVHPS